MLTSVNTVTDSYSLSLSSWWRAEGTPQSVKPTDRGGVANKPMRGCPLGAHVRPFTVYRFIYLAYVDIVTQKRLFACFVYPLYLPSPRQRSVAKKLVTILDYSDTTRSLFTIWGNYGGIQRQSD